MSLPPVVILCGGRGTRLQERTIELPKPLVEIGGRRILWHVLQLCVVQGARRFVLCGGYKCELLAEFARESAWPDGVEVECVDTGLDTPTGGGHHPGPDPPPGAPAPAARPAPGRRPRPPDAPYGPPCAAAAPNTAPPALLPRHTGGEATGT